MRLWIEITTIHFYIKYLMKFDNLEILNFVYFLFVSLLLPEIMILVQDEYFDKTENKANNETDGNTDQDLSTERRFFAGNNLSRSRMIGLISGISTGLTVRLLRHHVRISLRRRSRHSFLCVFEVGVK